MATIRKHMFAQFHQPLNPYQPESSVERENQDMKKRQKQRSPLMILTGALSPWVSFRTTNTLSTLNIKEKEWGREKTALVILKGAALSGSRLCCCNARVETISIPPPCFLRSLSNTRTYRSFRVSHPSCPRPCLFSSSIALLPRPPFHPGSP